MSTEEEDEFWAQVWTGNVNETDSMLESARQALDDAFVYPSDHTPPESWDECWAKFMAAWQALVEVYHSLCYDERFWRAHWPTVYDPDEAAFLRIDASRRAI